MSSISSDNNYHKEQYGFFTKPRNSSSTSLSPLRLSRIKKNKARQLVFLQDDASIEPEMTIDLLRLDLLKPHHLNCVKLIYGPIDFYLEEQLVTPTEINIISASAPDLSGKSAEDLQVFSKKIEKSRLLNLDIYTIECEKLACFIVETAKKQGNSHLVVSNFGLEVLSALNNANKNEAKKAMYQAFAKAALKYEVQIDWIVRINEFTPVQAAKQWSQFAPDNRPLRKLLFD